jgi:hypothetical protein
MSFRQRQVPRGQLRVPAVSTEAPNINPGGDKANEAVLGVTNQLREYADEEQLKYNKARAQHASLKYADLNRARKEDLSKKKMNDVQKAWDDIKKDRDSTLQSFINDNTDNDVQAEALKQDIERQNFTFDNWASNYNSAQRHVYATATNKATQQNLSTQAVANKHLIMNDPLAAEIFATQFYDNLNNHPDMGDLPEDHPIRIQNKQDSIDRTIGASVEDTIDNGKPQEALNYLRNQHDGLKISKPLETKLRQKAKRLMESESNELDKMLKKTPFVAWEKQGVPIPRPPQFNDPTIKDDRKPLIYTDRLKDYFDKSFEIYKKGASGSLKNKKGQLVKGAGAAKRLVDSRYIDSLKEKIHKFGPNSTAAAFEAGMVMKALDTPEKKRLFLEQLAPTTHETNPGSGISSQNMDMQTAFMASGTDTQLGKDLFRGMYFKFKDPKAVGAMTDFYERMDEKFEEYPAPAGQKLMLRTAAKLWAFNKYYNEGMEKMSEQQLLDKIKLESPDKYVDEFMKEYMPPTIQVQSHTKEYISNAFTGRIRSIWSKPYSIPAWRSSEGNEWINEGDMYDVLQEVNEETVAKYFEKRGLKEPVVYYGKRLDKFNLLTSGFQLTAIGDNRYVLQTEIFNKNLGEKELGNVQLNYRDKDGSYKSKKLVIDMQEFQRMIEGE